MTAGRGLDHDPLGPRQPGLHLLGQRIVTRDEADRHPPGAQRERVEAVLAGRPAVESRLDRCARVGVRDGAPRVTGPGVVADEERDIEAGAGSRPFDHRPRLLALEESGRRVDPRRQEVVHRTVAVVDEDLVPAARQRALDRRIRLVDHELDGRRIARVGHLGRVRMVDAGDALHVDADVDLHPSSAGPVRAWWPIQT